MTVVNAILTASNGIRSAVTGGEAPGMDALNKSIDSLKKMLVPQWTEDTERRAQEVREKIMEEVNRGPIQIKPVAREKKQRNRRG